MKTISFECSQFIAETAVDICDQIADLSRWPDFAGYGFLPGIDSATYDPRTPDMRGSRIRVRNTDGSEHVEDILEWVPGQRVVMRLHDFTPPLAHLAGHFMETWGFEPAEGGTVVTRSFELVPKRTATYAPLWLISQAFRRAIARHLADMAAEAASS